MAILASYATLTIALGQTVSDELPVAGDQNISVWLPTVWTAATLTIQAQREGSTDWATVCDADGPIVLPADANRVILLPASSLLPNGARKLRLVSSVAQAAARSIVVERRGF